MNNRWEKELKLIDNLGKLYSIFPNKYGFSIEYKLHCKNNFEKAWWVCWLCQCHLDCRLPQLEAFIKENDDCFMWDDYKDYFNITEE